MEKHVSIIGALQIGLSIFMIIIGLIVFVVLQVITGFTDDNNAQMILPLIGTIILSFFVFFSIPGIFAGIGLMRRKEWARVLSLILAVINLLNFPLGTAFGVYTLWALTQDETIALFQRVPKTY